MNRRTFIKTAALCSAGSLLVHCERSRKPNVILLITDDQGYGDLGCHGNPHVKTPNLDQLYNESLRLTDFHVGPTCAPTRASLMTGRYCNRTGVWHTVMGRSLLRSDEVTMADVFAQNGYKTGMFGKWHLGDSYPFHPEQCGFQATTAHGGGGIGQLPDYWGNDYFDDTYRVNGELRDFEGYCTDVWFDEAIKFIQSAGDQPFFCYLSTNAPHGPFHIDPEYSDPYLEKGIPPIRAQFYGMIENIDDNVAKLRRFLQQQNIAGHTLLIYMTDNGSSAGVDVDENEYAVNGYNCGMRGKKGSAYDGGHRVPCFIHWPDGGFTTGRDIRQLSAHIDLLPTLIDLCGLVKPDIKWDGTSLKLLLENPRTDADASWPERILITDSQRIEYPQKWRKSAVMSSQWRLIDGVELYDMQQDPGQTVDVAADHPETVEKLRTAYEHWWTDVSGRFDEYPRIIIGGEANPVHLTAHDWHHVSIPESKIPGPDQEINPPWNQRQVRHGEPANGVWALHVEKAGTYEIILSRWPLHLQQPIQSGCPGGGLIPGGTPYPAGKPLPITQARIRLQDIDELKPVASGDFKVIFRIRLSPGDCMLETFMIHENGFDRGAYFVLIEYKGDLS